MLAIFVHMNVATGVNCVNNSSMNLLPTRSRYYCNKSASVNEQVEQNDVSNL